MEMSRSDKDQVSYNTKWTRSKFGEVVLLKIRRLTVTYKSTDAGMKPEELRRVKSDEYARVDISLGNSVRDYLTAVRTKFFRCRIDRRTSRADENCVYQCSVLTTVIYIALRYALN